MDTISTVVLLLFCHLTSGNHTDVQTTEQRLLADLFRHYSPLARPVTNVSDSVHITISLVVTKLETLSLKKQTLVTSGYVRAKWLDKRLSWRPELYEGLSSIIVPPLTVWLPDFVLLNRVGPEIYSEDHYKLFKIHVQYDGLMYWTPGGEYQSQCSVDIRHFPFDEQRCTLIFANWVYTSAQVNLSYRECATDQITDSYLVNGEWDLVGKEVSREDRCYMDSGCSDKCVRFAEVSFTLHFRRKSLYYVMNIVVPSVILSSMVLMVLWLPSESGEKMSMGVTLLLSFTVFLLMVSEVVPNTSEAVPLIVIYLLTFMGCTSLTVMTSVVVLMVHHSHVASPPPSCLRKLAWAMNKKEMKVIDQLKNDMGSQITMKTSDDLAKDKTTLPLKGRATVESRILCHLDFIQSHLQGRTYKKVDEECRKIVEMEWRALAKALDRVAFWVVVGILIVCSLGILVIFPRV